MHTMLKTAVYGIEELRAVQNTADKLKVFTGYGQTYEEYCTLLIFEATSYDDHHKPNHFYPVVILITEKFTNMICHTMTLINGETMVNLRSSMSILMFKKSKHMPPTSKSQGIIGIHLHSSLNPYTKIWMINLDQLGHKSTQTLGRRLLGQL